MGAGSRQKLLSSIHAADQLEGLISFSQQRRRPIADGQARSDAEVRLPQTRRSCLAQRNRDGKACYAGQRRRALSFQQMRFLSLRVELRPIETIQCIKSEPLRKARCAIAFCKLDTRCIGKDVGRKRHIEDR